MLNLLLAGHTGFGTDSIATGNAGEHALTMELALRLRLAGGFGIEPFQFLDLFERFGGVDPSTTAPADHPDLMREGVQVFQVETANPHFHEDRGTDHVDDMVGVSLAAMYHSTVATPEVRRAIEEHAGGPPSPPDPPYPPLSRLDPIRFREVLTDGAPTFAQYFPEGVSETPIPG
jgi:mannosyl-3-phosphoglycerate synthase